MGHPDLALEHKVLREFKSLKNPPKRIILALSGGLDSMVLAEILCKWSRGLRIEMAVAHVHHGRSKLRRQNTFRDRTRDFVRAWAKARGLRFFTNRSMPRLNSEEEFRDFRHEHLAAWAKQFRAGAIVFAHHRDDLLETRVIRLIRGSGHQGLESMALWRGGKLRPLLSASRAEIAQYARTQRLQWIEDPSNENQDVLRNWLRHEWLPSLEKQRPGSLKSFARSLAHVTAKTPAPEFELAPYVGLRREIFAAGPSAHSRQVVARYFKSIGLKGYTHSHVEEILKRLCSKRESQAFALLGVRFHISEQFLWASRV